MYSRQLGFWRTTHSSSKEFFQIFFLIEVQLTYNIWVSGIKHNDLIFLYSPLPKANGCVPSTQGTPLEHLALGNRGPFISKPHGSETIRETGYHPQGITQISDSKTPRLSMKKVYLLAQEFHPKGQTSGFPHI